MRNHTFTFNGHSSDEFGLKIEHFPNANRPARKYDSANVPGRNGMIYDVQDAWEEVTQSYEIFAKGQRAISIGDVAVASFMTSYKQSLDDLTVSIAPTQNLNGYDHPWAGGAGKNLIPYPYYETTHTTQGITWTVNADGSITANGTATANSYFFVRRVSQESLGLPTGNYVMSCLTTTGSATTFDAYTLRTDGKSTSGGADYGNGHNVTITDSTAQMDVIIRIISGYTANNLVFKPMIRLASNTDSTWEPYENICPISGRDAVKVYRTRKNLIPYPYYNGSSKTQNGITFTVNADGSVTANGTATAEANFFFTHARYTNWRVPNGSYKIINGTGDIGTSSTYYIRVNALYGDTTKVIMSTYSESPFELTDEYGDLGCYIAIRSGVTVNNLLFKPMICLATDTDDSWESPVDNETTSISLGRTVYGGTLNVTTGELTVDRRLVEFDGSGDESWSSSSVGASGQRFYIKNTNAKASGEAISNRFAYTSSTSTSQAWGLFNISSSQNIIFYDTNHTFASSAEFKTWLESNPIQVVYELAEPVTYSLSGTEITTLLGENNIWTDAGNVVNLEVPEFTIQDVIYLVMKWLHSASGYARLEDTYDPKHYREAIFLDQTDIVNTWNEYGRAIVMFRCRPERFIKTEDIVIDSSTETVQFIEVIRDSVQAKVIPYVILDPSNEKHVFVHLGDVFPVLDTANNPYQVRYTTDVPVRRSPSASSERLGTLSAYQAVYIQGVVENYYRIFYGGADTNVGYVAVNQYAIITTKNWYKIEVNGLNRWVLEDDVAVRTGYVIDNPTAFIAKPVIEMYAESANRNKKLYLNGTHADVVSETSTPLMNLLRADCESENFYAERNNYFDVTNVNKYVKMTKANGTASADFFKLKSGENYIYAENYTDITIQPRFWEV